jgi:hypothetical protein
MCECWIENIHNILQTQYIENIHKRQTLGIETEDIHNSLQTHYMKCFVE